MASVVHYARVYREFLSNSFAQATSFRAHFVLLIVMDLLFYLSTMATIGFIYEHVETIGPWNREQFLFFASFMLAVDHLHMTFISESFWEFSFDIRTGKLDFILLKPIGTLFSIFFRFIRPATLCNIFVPWGLLIYYGMQLDLALWAWVALPGMVLLALVALTSFEILLSMTMFLTIESFGINFLRMQFQQMARYPDFAYRYLARKFFTIVAPILLIGSAPVRFLFEASDWGWLLYLVGSILVCWILIGITWRAGLRYYESASS